MRKITTKWQISKITIIAISEEIFDSGSPYTATSTKGLPSHPRFLSQIAIFTSLAHT